MTADLAQLALPVHLRDDATLDNFLFTDNLGALKHSLQQLPGAEPEAAIHLFGPPGSGRSHLLQAVCHQAGDGEALYLPLEQLAALDPAEVLAGIESLSLVSLDNIDAVCGLPEWEEALFHLVNRARENRCGLLFSASAAPRQLPVKLPDLQSRLGWGLVFQLPQVSDPEKLAILQFRAERRGLELPEEVGSYILARAPRSLAALVTLLEQLDRDSMAAQRQLTIPFVKQSLGW